MSPILPGPACVEKTEALRDFIARSGGSSWDVWTPGADDSGEHEQAVGVAGAPEPIKALAPQGEALPVWLDGPGDNRKTLALREFIENLRKPIVTLQAEGLHDLAQVARELAADHGPREVEPLADGVGVAVQPAGLDHPVHEALVEALHLGVGEHAPEAAFPIIAGPVQNAKTLAVRAFLTGGPR